MSSLPNLVRTFAAIAMVVCAFAPDATQAKTKPAPAPAPEPTAEAVPAELAEASKAAFDSGAPYFIWRDTSDVVVIPARDFLLIKIHFAVAPGAKPDRFTALLRVTARDAGGQMSTIVMMGGGGTTLAIMNQGSHWLQGEGTAEIYFAPEGMTDPSVAPLSNVLSVPIRFQ
jgi:hypothetical protein